MMDLTQRFPVELLAEILGYVSALEILRLKQVNRAFRDVVLSSPLIQHKLDLHAIGLEHNPAAGIDLTESRKAFCQYLTSYCALSPTEERTMVDNLRTSADVEYIKVAGGVYAILEDQVRLFTLGSVSRGIPYNEWTIPLPIIAPQDYNFYPGADVIAFLELQGLIDVEIVVHLRTLSSGGFHPAAQFPKILYSQKGADAHKSPLMSISGSRLALVIDLQDGICTVIWDWKSAQIVFSLENESCISAEFIDDYRLLVSCGPSGGHLPCIVLMDTEKDMGGVPARTSFQLFPYLPDLWDPSLLLEWGAHKPSPAEHLAPFYQDPAQRIAALSMPRSLGYLVFSVETLVRLAEGREGCEIGWDEWKKHVVIPSIHRPDIADVWVSGCRLFCIDSVEDDSEPTMGVYDFSKKGRVEYLGERADPDLVGVRYLSSTGARVQLPWEDAELVNVSGGRDGVIFFVGIEYFPREREEEGFLHMWKF